MDDSKLTVTPPPQTPAPSQNGVMTRTLVSAGVFGAIGMGIGHLLGRSISNKVVEPILRWSMGSFWAVLAAYSSLKAAAMERGEIVTETPTPVVHAVPIAKVPLVEELPNAKKPLSLIEVDTMQDHGHVQPAPELELAGK